MSPATKLAASFCLPSLRLLGIAAYFASIPHILVKHRANQPQKARDAAGTRALRAGLNCDAHTARGKKNRWELLLGWFEGFGVRGVVGGEVVGMLVGGHGGGHVVLAVI